jgi:membrane-bound lytic murein transglycosylase D
VERLAEEQASSSRLELLAAERQSHEVGSSRVVEDPWADAVAEAARSRPPAAPPAYQVVINSHVQSFLERFTGSRRDVVGLWLNRSRRYLDMIRTTLREQGLPEELAFVAMIESGFNPLAVSRAGAKGLWQFMADTARRYGLRVDKWVDERFDPEKSTLAAARYLRDLYSQFGSWALAKAAYNAGELKVAQAIRVVGSKDFWTLAGTRLLKQETRDFVPAIHAATVIGRDPERYGFALQDSEPVATDTVVVPPATNLRVLASASGVPVDALQRLNPVLVRGITPPGTPYHLRVPAGSAGAVRTALARPTRSVARVPVRRAAAAHGTVGADIHVVRPRDTVVGIARLYGVRVADVMRWNDLDERARIRPGDRLRIREARVSAQASPSTGR